MEEFTSTSGQSVTATNGIYWKFLKIISNHNLKLNLRLECALELLTCKLLSDHLEQSRIISILATRSQNMTKSKRLSKNT